MSRRVFPRRYVYIYIYESCNHPLSITPLYHSSGIDRRRTTSLLGYRHRATTCTCTYVYLCACVYVCVRVCMEKGSISHVEFGNGTAGGPTAIG